MGVKFTKGDIDGTTEKLHQLILKKLKISIQESKRKLNESEKERIITNEDKSLEKIVKKRDHERKIEESIKKVMSLSGADQETLNRLVKAGYTSLESLAYIAPFIIIEDTGLNKEIVYKFVKEAMEKLNLWYKDGVLEKIVEKQDHKRELEEFMEEIKSSHEIKEATFSMLVKSGFTSLESLAYTAPFVIIEDTGINERTVNMLVKEAMRRIRIRDKLE